MTGRLILLERHPTRRYYRCARCTVLRWEGDGDDATHADCPWFPTDPSYQSARPTDGLPVRFPPGWIDPPNVPYLTGVDDPRWPRRSFLHWLMGVPAGWPWN